MHHKHVQRKIGFAVYRMDCAGRYIRRKQAAALNQCCLCTRLQICRFEVYMEGHWNPVCERCVEF